MFHSISYAGRTKVNKRLYSTNVLPPPRVMPQRRVVVTGLGLVSPLGCGVSPTWSNLIQGSCGTRLIRNVDVSNIPSKVAAQGECVEKNLLAVLRGSTDSHPFILSEWVPKEWHSQIPLFVGFALAAASQAIQDSGWDGDRTTAGLHSKNSFYVRCGHGGRYWQCSRYYNIQ